MNNWKTTITGVGLILGAVALLIAGLTDSDPATPSWEAIGAGFIAGWGLIFAKDNNK